MVVSLGIASSSENPTGQQFGFVKQLVMTRKLHRVFCDQSWYFFQQCNVRLRHKVEMWESSL